MIEQIRQRFNRWFLNKELGKISGRRSSIPLQSAASALILTENRRPEALQAATYLKNRLVKMGKQVTVAVFDNKQGAGHESADIHFFTHKDLDWALRPASASLKSILDQPFDLLFYLVDKPCTELDYLVAVSHARFRIGPYIAANGVCELMIVPDSADLKKFADLMMFYLEKLNPPSKSAQSKSPDEPQLVRTTL